MELLKKTNSCYMGTFHRFFIQYTHTSLTVWSGARNGYPTLQSSEPVFEVHFTSVLSSPCKHEEESSQMQFLLHKAETIYYVKA